MFKIETKYLKSVFACYSIHGLFILTEKGIIYV